MVNAMKHLRRIATLSRWLFPVGVVAGWIVGAHLAPAQTLEKEAVPGENFERKPLPGTPGPWRLVRTPNPAGGRDAVSIMRTADTVRSDLEFAGLMLRCSENNAEVLIVLVRPIPPRAHPKVIVNFNGRSAEFTAVVVPPGAAVLLPSAATILAAGAWQSAPELAVTVDDEQGPIRGTVSLAGLSAAFHTLRENCPSS
jgi:hypothetical protein